MKNDTPKPKKAYAPPTITRHGEIVTKTLGAAMVAGEMFVPGSPDWH